MRRTVVLIVVALVLAACQGLKPDPAVESQARTLYTQFGADQEAAIAAQMPAPTTPATFQAISKIHALVPQGKIQGVKLVRASVVDTVKTGKSVTLAHEYDYADRTALFGTRFTLAPGDKQWRLQGFNLVVASHRELAVNSFAFNRKSPGQFAFLGFAAASPALMVLALLVVARAKALRRKWAWAILSLVGVSTFQMNWTTGHVFVQWIAVQLVGFGVSSGPSRFDPWIVKASLPVGALLVLAILWARPSKTGKSAAETGDAAS